MDNMFYDEKLHEDCIESMRLFIKLYIEFCSKDPNPEISGHVIREAETLNEIVQDNNASKSQIIDIYTALINEIKDEDLANKFLDLPLIFLAKKLNK